MKRLARALERARSSRSRIAKEEALAGALAEVAEDGDDLALSTAARLAVGRTVAVGDDRSLGAGHSLLMEIAVARSGYRQEIVRSCARTTGDLGEAMGLLAARAPGAHDRPGLRLRDVASLFQALASTGARFGKRRALEEALSKATPLEIKYLTKALLGSLRVGAQEGVMEGAIARAFGQTLADVRRAASLVTDPGTLAVLAHRGQLGEARMQIGRPVAFMLATPVETLNTPMDPGRYILEEKIDGVRAQVHKWGNEVSVFARGLVQTTTAFPELVDAFRFVPGSVALDGEIVALTKDGRPRPFQALQARLRRLTPSRELLTETPVVFIAYDILFDDDGDLLALPWEARRARLEAFARERGPRTSFLVHTFVPCPSLPEKSLAPASLVQALDELFDRSRARGYEGLVLKRKDSVYEAGRRGQAWLKVKRAFATLDVVITAAEEGHGRRAGLLSDYTFGVWDRDELVNVGKAYSGLTDEEIEGLGKTLEGLSTGRFGSVRAIRPAIVLEVGFDGVQTSARHKSGYALRFPRIVRIRHDKRAEEADVLATVAALFDAQVETGHREAEKPAATRAPRPKKAKPDQLNLFEPSPKRR